MNSGATLYLAGGNWLLPVAIALAGAIVFIAASYLHTQAPRGLRLVCAALKLTGVAVLFACLLEPM